MSKTLTRATYAVLLAGALTATSVVGGQTITASGEPVHTPLSVVASLNPVSAEPAEANSKRGRWICNINWFRNLCQHTRD